MDQNLDVRVENELTEMHMDNLNDILLNKFNKHMGDSCG